MPRFVTTAALFTVTAVPSVAQFFVTGLEPALMRDPAAVRAGEWWRLGTSLVVQDGGVFGTLFNLAFLAVLGYLAERSLGPGRCLLLYAAGAVAGQAAGMLFAQPGAGNSIALCGLAAGLAVASRPLLERSVGAFYAVTLLAYVLVPAGGTWGVLVMVAIAGLGFQLVAQRERLPWWAFPPVPALVGVALAALADLHGVALLGGMIAAWTLSAASPSTSRPTSPA
ncbi:rhomboid family intramembrane serine protease [Nonomuraea rhizosphaerae]|uniref:rhomboid family intramembrane serine protease n=1 Tax=Nonomuraea rhizosphaerae TaxID=2665663 RepID=UPI001C5CE989|nr:rhomboid family intramembrane serine protease [Nonomuraea rhizosphaerae]